MGSSILKQTRKSLVRLFNKHFFKVDPHIQKSHAARKPVCGVSDCRAARYRCYTFKNLIKLDFKHDGLGIFLEIYPTTFPVLVGIILGDP